MSLGTVSGGARGRGGPCPHAGGACGATGTAAHADVDARSSPVPVGPLTRLARNSPSPDTHIILHKDQSHGAQAWLRSMNHDTREMVATKNCTTCTSPWVKSSCATSAHGESSTSCT